ncbi:MAG: hypothetical protein ICV87_13100, partial [Gemmatimonadetes bacterium]|nr:hypothetical protein [Gemmatimonadota bacterium]
MLAPSDSLPAIAPLRTAQERREDAEREFLVGPAVRFLAPMDGSVLATNRVAVIVLGEPGASLRLIRGDCLLATGSFRPDGRAEFAGVDLTRGPNRLRVEMTNSWQQARWDSVGIHYSGEPARIELSEMASMRADARDTARVMALVRDEWGVPVAGQPMVTVSLGGAKLLGTDADQRAIGFQARAARNGVLALNVAPEHDPGLGSLTLTARKARARIPVRVLPADRALTATGIGQVGVGAAPGSFGAVLMRGALGDETFVTLSYDSRRNGSRDPYFQRGYDPLDESHYPTYGDASERRVFSGATQTFSAKLQHRYDWVELGDVTVDFGDRRLAGYQRSLSGVSSRVERGLLTVKSFGSITDQTLVQRQIRGEGTSGPYRLGLGIRPGTERLAVEVRARDNAARLVQRQELTRGFDYQIDYGSGEVILQRAIGTVDAGGNPIFLVGTMELRSGGESRFVGGMRMEMDASRLVRRGAMDSLGVALFGVHDGAAGGAATGSSALMGGDMKLRFGGFSVGTAVMRSSS